MKKIGLFYAPAKGNTEKIARLIQHKIGKDNIDLVLIEENSEPSILADYSKIVFGISTIGRDSWNSNYKKTGWDYFLPKLEKANLKEKTVAIYGLGDHLLYPAHFVDSIGVLAKIFVKNGAKLIGKTSAEGYTFKDSEAIQDGVFAGLPIDEDKEPELTEPRIDKWLTVILNQFEV